MQKRLVKTPSEIELIAEGGKIMNDILARLSKMSRPGVSTFELDEFAEEGIRRMGGRPSFLGYGPKKNPFPATLCTSVNSQVVHGIPGKNVILKSGDILGLDIGMEYKGLYTDTAVTVLVGTVGKDATRLVQTTKLALDRAIKQAKAGNKMGDVSAAIQNTAEAAGFSVVRELVGHGVGYDVHEDPQVPCYGKPGTGIDLVEGMVLAIEPMVCQRSSGIVLEEDGWTISTADGGLAAHFEHTIVVGKKGARTLT